MQLKVIQNVTYKGKSSSKLHQAEDELDYLITFQWIITQTMARSMQDCLSDGVFMTNFTVARRDSYLEYIKAGIKEDIFTCLRTAPIHMSALFPDHIISTAEEEIRHHEDKHTSGPSRMKSLCYHPYSRVFRQQLDSDLKPGPPALTRKEGMDRGLFLHTATRNRDRLVTDCLFVTSKEKTKV